MTLVTISSALKNGNFNSHAHVERDTITLWLDVATRISTHTLTWSVTNPKGEYWNYFYISTHTLTWSVTFRIVINVADDKNFNSHAHVERD